MRLKAQILFLFIAMALGGTVNLSAQVTAGDLFVNAPFNLFPLLERNTRLDMIDYYMCGSSKQSSNRLSGQSHITNASTDNIEIEMSESSCYQISLLPMGNDTIALLIKTVKTPIADSEIGFYTLNWQKINKELIKTPTIHDWVTKDGKKHIEEIETTLPFMLADYKYNPATHQLVVTNGMKEFYTQEEYDKIASYLKPTLTYKWNGKKMTIEK